MMSVSDEVAAKFGLYPKPPLPPSFTVYVLRQLASSQDGRLAATYATGDLLRYRKSNKAIGVKTGDCAQVVNVNPLVNTIAIYNLNRNRPNNGIAIYDPSQHGLGAYIYKYRVRNFYIGDQIRFTEPWTAQKIPAMALAVITAIDDADNIEVQLCEGRSRSIAWKVRSMPFIDIRSEVEDRFPDKIRHFYKKAELSAANREQGNAGRRIRYHNNIDRERARSRSYSEEHKAVLAPKRKAHRSAHPEQHLARTRNYRSKKRSAPGSHTPQDIAAIWKRQRYLCAVPGCTHPISASTGQDKYHVDHVRALKNGGSNYPDNLQLLCGYHNQAKSDNDEYEWAQAHGLLFFK